MGARKASAARASRSKRQRQGQKQSPGGGRERPLSNKDSAPLGRASKRRTPPWYGDSETTGGRECPSTSGCSCGQEISSSTGVDTADSRQVAAAAGQPHVRQDSGGDRSSVGQESDACHSPGVESAQDPTVGGVGVDGAAAAMGAVGALLLEKAATAVPSPGIPFHKVTYLGREFQYVAESMLSGKISGDGTFTRRAQALLEEAVGCRQALLTTSCTDALEMCALLLDIKEGDEVIVPSFTYVSTVNAFTLHGARPVFVDVRPDTLNLDEARLERAITPRTRAIVVVHYGGNACEMDTIMNVAARHGVPVVEDNAHALFGSYKGRPLGSIGALATLSFHETKNFTCGEGGALLINDPALLERASVLRLNGTDRTKFLAGLVDKYTWVDRGSSFLPSDMLAAILTAQLEMKDTVQERRRQIWHRYHAALCAWAAREGIRLPPASWNRGDVNAYHIFHMLLPSPAARSRLSTHLKERGFATATHYQPLHLSPMGIQYGGASSPCPVSEMVAAQMLRLPIFTSLSEADQTAVCEAILSFSCSQPQPMPASPPPAAPSQLPAVSPHPRQRLCPLVPTPRASLATGARSIGFSICELRCPIRQKG